MNIFEQAKALSTEIIEHRRALHTFPEIGFDLPKTTAFVESKLKEYGCAFERVGKAGIVCTIGQGKKTFLLRADMDALPMQEVEQAATDGFRSQTGHAHTCGHDAHTAMLLGAAKLLKQNEGALKGCVKLMFQPAEEILAGALDMINHGVLENPKVDAAMALHIIMGTPYSNSGVVYGKGGDVTYSADAIQVRIEGKDAHGSTPYLGIDANVIAAHIVVALQSIIPNEVSPDDKAVILVGKIAGGTAVNSVSGSAVLDISTRARTPEIRAFLQKRIEEVATQTALMRGGKVEVKHLYGMPPLVNDVALTEELKGYCANVIGADHVKEMPTFTGSEDFSMMTERLPAVFFALGVGGIEEGYEHSLHHPAMRLDEKALATGVAVHVGCAMQWLENNA